MLGEQQALHVRIGDGLALLIAAALEAGSHGQASRGGGSGDQALSAVEAAQGHAGPVDADEAEEAMLDRVPLCALPRCTDDVGANPTRQLSLQPEAAGADQEATNGLKHFRKRSLLGISGPYGPQHRRTPTRPRKDQCESRPASGTGRPS